MGDDGTVEALVVNNQQVLPERHSVQTWAGWFARQTGANDEGGRGWQIDRFSAADRLFAKKLKVQIKGQHF